MPLRLAAGPKSQNKDRRNKELRTGNDDARKGRNGLRKRNFSDNGSVGIHDTTSTTFAKQKQENSPQRC